MSDTPSEWYSLAQVAILFKQLPSTIKRRCANGEFEYEVGPGGHHKISVESVRAHMQELETKNYG